MGAVEDTAAAERLRGWSTGVLVGALATIALVCLVLLTLAVLDLGASGPVWNTLAAVALAAAVAFVVSAVLRRRAERIDPARAPWQHLHDSHDPHNPEEH